MQERDIELCKIRYDYITSLVFEEVQFDSIKVICDVSTGLTQLFIPKSLRQKVFESIHNISHPRIKPMV